MRLWHLIFGILASALMLTIARDPAGLVGLIVFFVGLAEVVVGTGAILALFQTIGAIGEAHSPLDHAEALFATTVVFTLGTSMMSGLLFVGCWLVSVAVA